MLQTLSTILMTITSTTKMIASLLTKHPTFWLGTVQLPQTRTQQTRILDVKHVVLLSHNSMIGTATEFSTGKMSMTITTESSICLTSIGIVISIMTLTFTQSTVHFTVTTVQTLSTPILTATVLQTILTGTMTMTVFLTCMIQTTETAALLTLI